VLTIDEIADLLVSAEAEILPAGNYVNRRGILGYFLISRRSNAVPIGAKYRCRTLSVTPTERPPKS
jgi:hypothetical protein